jgi:hypothetical protein
MEYCSYEEAFPQIGGGPSSPGCVDQTGSKAARKEERKKAKRCKGPPLTFLDLDPDRPAVQRVPAVPPLNPATGLREHAPVDAPQAEPFQDVNVPYDLTSQRQPDDAGQVARNTFPNVPGQNKVLKKEVNCNVPSYFGASGDMEEGFQGTFGLKPKNYAPQAPYTDVIGKDDGYRLYPDFQDAFKRVVSADAAAGKSMAPIPSVVNEWKPLTPTGARTAFFDELPPPGGQYPKGTSSIAMDDPAVLSNKIDTLFTRLDDLESRRGENTQTEILLFVMSGLFVLFSMDIMSKQAARIRLM